MNKKYIILLLLFLLTALIFAHQSCFSKTIYAIKDTEGSIIAVTDVNCISIEMIQLGYTLEYFCGEKTARDNYQGFQNIMSNNTDTSPWYIIYRWQGKSTKNTETFRIPTNEWRISWNTEPGEYGDMNFIISAYKPPSELSDVVANVIGRDRDSSIMRGAGDYYLSINTAQQYEVVVEAKRETGTTAVKEESVTAKTGWHKVAGWQGKSTKNTETFRIPTNEWRISWNTEPGEYGDMNFIISAYKPPSELSDVVANVIGRDRDSSIMRGAGDYYLSINTAQQYEVVVEAKY